MKLTDEQIRRVAGAYYADGSYDEELIGFARALLSSALATEGGEAVAEVKIEPDYWNRGHFYEGKEKDVKLLKAFYDLPVGTKLYAAPQSQVDSGEANDGNLS